jgi:phenol/toluene 2-monooxygenase (NADH) P4/A4
MTIRALRDDYHGEFKDSLEKFGGAQLVYLGWDKHQMFCSSRAYPIPPEMRFQELLDNVMPEAFGQHPEFTQIDWNKAQWILDNSVFQPDHSKTLAELCIGHKSLLRLVTPELTGYKGAGI